MRIKGFASIVALSLAAAACGQGDSGNVMAPSGNALSPAQVDLALGPEIANATVDEVESANEVSSGTSAIPEDRPQASPASNTAEEMPAEDETEDSPTEENTSAEE